MLETIDKLIKKIEYQMKVNKLISMNTKNINDLLSIRDYIEDLEEENKNMQQYIKYFEKLYEDQIINLISENQQLESEIKCFKKVLNNFYGRDIYE